MPDVDYTAGPHPAVRVLKIISRAGSLTPVVIGIAVLIGWWLDIPALKSVLPNLVPMKANTAMAFILAGLSLSLLTKERQGKSGKSAQERLGRLAALAVVSIGLLTLLEFASGWDLHIDQLLFREPIGPPGANLPGRMSPLSAANFVLIGPALLLLDWGVWRKNQVSQLLALGSLALPMGASISYSYGLAALYEYGFTAAIAVHTVLAFFLLGIGILFARPDQPPVAIFLGSAPGSAMLRRLLPIAILVPTLLGILREIFAREGLLQGRAATVLMVVITIPIFAIILWLTAIRLNRSELERRLTEGRFQLLFASNPLPMWVWDVETLSFLEVNEAAVAHYGYSREEFLGMRITDIKLAEDIPDFLELIGQPRTSLGHHRGTRHRLKDGRIIDVSADSHTLEWRGRKAILVALEDVTDRKRAEQALAASEVRYRRLFEAAKDGILILDAATGAIVDANPFLEKLIGLSHEEIVGKALWKIGLFKDEEKSKAAFRELQDTGNIRYEDLPLETSDGFLRQVEFVSNVYKVDGRMVIQCNIRDITERKRADEALQFSEARLKEAQQIAQLGYWERDLGTGVSSWSGECCRIFGRDPNLPAPSLRELRTVFTEQSWLLLQPAIERAISSGEPWALELEIIRGDGAHGWIVSRGQLIRDAAGRGVRLSGTTQDITKRKRADEALRESEEKYRKIVETANEGIWMMDPEGKTIFANRQMAQMLGYTTEELHRLSVFDVTYDSDLADARARAEQRRKGVAQNRDIRYRRKDGSELWAMANVSPMLDATGNYTGTVGLLTDITERKRIEQQLQLAQKMEAVGQLAGGIAHDFNNMLNIILGYCELLQERLQPDDPSGRMLEQIQKAGDRAATLTRQLLAFSRQQVLQLQVMDLNAMVIETGRMIRRLIGENISVLVELAPDLGGVKADHAQLEQVVVNLAINARDAMPNGGELLITTANVDLDLSYSRMRPLIPPGPYVRLTVSDTGVGMDQETQSHIFEPFFTTKEAGKGTGLGLATVYGTIKQSGGFIWVYSEPGKGTTFKIYLPRVDQAAEGYEVRMAVPSSAAGHETILIVEDEESLRELNREFLSGSGYTLLEAKDGTDALEIAGKHPGPIHLLLTDVVMPGMSGRELMERLAPVYPGMRVLFVSGYPDKDINHYGVLELGKAFLEKPFSKNDLIRKVRELLDAPPVIEHTI